MQAQSFVENMDSLCKWFNKKLTGDQYEEWQKELKYIPDGPWYDICQHIKETEKYFPTLKAFKIAYGEYKKQNPDQFIKEYEKEECKDCDSKGFHIFVDTEMRYHCFPCSQCRNWRNEFPTYGKNKPTQFVTKQQIMDAGCFLSMRKYLDAQECPF